jgi:hypothetical protein
MDTNLDTERFSWSTLAGRLWQHASKARIAMFPFSELGSPLAKHQIYFVLDKYLRMTSSVHMGGASWR